MKESNRASPATLILMVAGIGVCVAFIVHGISALSSPPATAQSAVSQTATTQPDPGKPDASKVDATQTPATQTPAIRPASGKPALAKTALTQPAQPGTSSAVPLPVVTSDPSGTAAGPVFPAPQEATAVLTEADLAPNADPFTPIGGWSVIPAGAPAPAPPIQAAALPPIPGPPVKGPMAVPGTLRGFSVQEPELVGTLLGDRPSAVFRVDQRIVTVAQGAQIIGWKVVSIQQGSAVLQGMGRTLKLTTVKSGIAAGNGSSYLNSASLPQHEVAAAVLPGSSTSSISYSNSSSPNSSPVSGAEPHAAVSGNITVTTVEVPAARANQSSLPRRTVGYNGTPDEAGDSNSVAVSGPFVHPAPQLSGPSRNSRGEDFPVPPGEPSPEPMQSAVVYRTGLSGSQNESDANSNQIVAQGPRPRHHRRIRRHRRRVHHRFAAAHRHHA